MTSKAVDWKYTHLASDTSAGNRNIGLYVGVNGGLHWELETNGITSGSQLIMIGTRNVSQWVFADIEQELVNFLKDEYGPPQRLLTFEPPQQHLQRHQAPNKATHKHYKRPHRKYASSNQTPLKNRSRLYETTSRNTSHSNNRRKQNLTTDTKDGWKQFKVGMVVDCCDQWGKWYRSKIMKHKTTTDDIEEKDELNEKQKERYHELQGFEAIYVNYIDWDHKYDEWIFIDPEMDIFCECKDKCDREEESNKHRIAVAQTQSVYKNRGKNKKKKEEKQGRRYALFQDDIDALLEVDTDRRLQGIRKDKQRLQTELKSKNKRITQLEQNETQIVEQLGRFRFEIYTLKGDINDKQRDLEEAMTNNKGYKTIESECNILKGKYNALITKQKNNKWKIDDTEKLKSKIQAFEKQKEEDMNGLRVIIERLKKEKIETDNKYYIIEQLKDELKYAKRILNTKEESERIVNQYKDQFKNEVISKIKEKDTEIETLKRTIESQKKQQQTTFKDNWQTMKEQTRRIATLKYDINEGKNMYNTLHSQHQTLNEEYTQILLKNEEKNRTLNETLAENKRFKERIYALENEQKQYEMEINTLKTENQELKEKLIDESRYKEWNYEKILMWILSLEHGRYSKYENVLRNNLKEEQVIGDHLNDVNEFDVKGWGITNFSDKKSLAQQIQRLVHINKNIIVKEGNNVPTAYI